jgi:hypothetical protein
MKKIVSLLLVSGALGAGFWFYNTKMQHTNDETSAPVVSNGKGVSAPSTAGDKQRDSRDTLINSVTQGANQSENQTNVVGSETFDEIKPASEAYSSAEEALAAALKGAKDFDDSVLEQFTEPSPDCSWCSAFYSSVQGIVLNPNTPQDQKSYMAELLAISGRPENVQTLVDAIKNAPNTTEADLFAEALELTLGKDEVVKVLGDQLSTTNDTLREASVAAITNQGTKYAAETLQKHILERNDPDAYYSQGFGPGEFIPDEEALPYIQELVQKRDQYSAVWAKSLINAGLPGLQSLFEQLENSSNPEADRALTKDALAHVNFEDGIKEMTDNVIANNRSSVAVDFAKQIQAEISQQEIQEDEGATEPSP